MVRDRLCGGSLPPTAFSPPPRPIPVLPTYPPYLRLVSPLLPQPWVHSPLISPSIAYSCFGAGKLHPCCSLGHWLQPQPGLIAVALSPCCCYRARLGSCFMPQAGAWMEPTMAGARVSGGGGRDGRGEVEELGGKWRGREWWGPKDVGFEERQVMQGWQEEGVQTAELGP